MTTKAVLIGLLSVWAIAVGSAQGATITVNETADELNGDGDCSLREAIQAANTDAAVDACTAGSGADTINVPPGTYILSIPGADEDNNATGDLDIFSDVTLIGGGRDTTIIDGGGLDRVVDVRCVRSKDPDPRRWHQCVGVTRVIVRGFTIRNGAPPMSRGGGFRNAGDAGRSAVTPVTLLEQCRFTGNTSSSGGAVGDEGVLTVRNCIIEGNSATGYGAGGGIDTFGVTTIEDSVIRNNTAARIGGGVFNNARMTIRRSLIAGNTAGEMGGGYMDINGASTLVNVTVSGNTTTSGDGGGVVCGDSYNSCDIAMSHSTVTANHAPSGSGGGIARIAGTFAVKNSIVAANKAHSNGDASGNFVSGGFNLVQDITGASGFSGPDDQIGVDARLGALANNGGPSETHALAPNSPAVNAGTCLDIAGSTVSEDQRGIARPRSGRCDIGAFEF